MVNRQRKMFSRRSDNKRAAAFAEACWWTNIPMGAFVSWNWGEGLYPMTLMGVGVLEFGLVRYQEFEWMGGVWIGHFAVGSRWGTRERLGNSCRCV